MAVHTISPGTDLTAFIASASVSPGDVLLLRSGVYRQAVLINKNYVRIIAFAERVVFDGEGALLSAFTLVNAVGVELCGITIRNYQSRGVQINGGSANRVIDNDISSVGSEGVLALTSAGNLIRGNSINEAWDGVQLRQGSTNNFVLTNRAQNCLDDGFESFLLQDANNAFVGNAASRCGGNGFEIFGANNLVDRNRATGAFNGFLFANGSNSVAVGNQSWGNRNDGFSVSIINLFAAENVAWRNENNGFRILGDSGIYQENTATCNGENGLLLTPDAAENLVLRNCLERNFGQNLLDQGTRNNLIENNACACAKHGGPR